MSANGMARPCSGPARRKILRGIKKHKEHVPCHTNPPSAGRSRASAGRLLPQSDKYQRRNSGEINRGRNSGICGQVMIAASMSSIGTSMIIVSVSA